MLYSFFFAVQHTLSASSSVKLSNRHLMMIWFGGLQQCEVFQAQLPVQQHTLYLPDDTLFSFWEMEEWKTTYLCLQVMASLYL